MQITNDSTKFRLRLARNVKADALREYEAARPNTSHIGTTTVEPGTVPGTWLIFRDGKCVGQYCPACKPGERLVIA